MAIRYVKDFEFPSAAGYSKSSPSKVTGQMLAKGGQPKGLMVVIGVGKPKGPVKKAEGGPLTTGLAEDEGRYTEATRNARAQRQLKDFRDKAAEARWAASQARGSDWADKKSRADTADEQEAFARKYADKTATETGYKKGGKVAKVMHEFGEGKLHSGSKKGPKVTNPKQAVAIALNEQREAKKAKGGDVKSVPVKDIKSGKIPQSTDEDFYGKAKDMPMPTRRPATMKNGGYAEGGKAVKVPLPAEDEAPYPAQWPMPSDEQMNKENWNQRKAIRRAMGAKNTGKDTFAKGGMAHEDVAADKSLIKSMVKPAALKKAMGGQAVQMAKSNAVEASMKGQKKTPYADGGMALAAPQVASPLQQMARKSVPVAPRAPMIPQQAAPAGGGPRIGVGRSRSGKPNVGAIRAAMARAATQATPENAPGMMKKGGKVGC